MDTLSSDEATRLAEPISVAGGPALQSEAAGHFDAVDTHFFQQADEAGSFGGDERYDEPPRGRDRRPILSYGSLVGVSVASGALAIAASVALFRSNAPFAAPMAGTAVSAKVDVPHPSVPRPPMVTNPAVALAPQAAPTPSASAAEPAPQDPSGSAAPPAPRDEAEKGEAPKPASVTGAEAQVATLTPAPGGDARERCRQSIRGKRSKEVVAACAAAFAEDATDADAAIAVARVEFDRGRFTQASAWSRKAIVANPNSAEAYVFVGGAEQNQGRGKAAKEAYLRYLRLAPSGRYAAEIRTIVGSL